VTIERPGEPARLAGVTVAPTEDARPDGPERSIMHVDMDAFFAAVEIKEQPSLSGLPVVVGGSGPRGVVASASYEARAFGVRSAMPGALARRLCPELVILPPRFGLYHACSEHLHEVLRSFTPLVEGLGLDEAFLDMTRAGGLFGPPLRVGSQVRERVASELGLGCSVGTGPNKLVAKLASKAAKPLATRQGPRPGRGVVVIAQSEVLDFLWPMQVEALWGVGPASAARLHQLGVTTVGQLAALPRDSVAAALGKSAGHLVHSLAWGHDPRPVVPERPVKSIGHEETYPVDIVERDELERRLVVMADSVAARARQEGFLARTVTLKLRYGDFTTLTRSHTFDRPQTSGPSLWSAAKALLGQLDVKTGVRLLGLSASGLVPVESSPGEQLQLELGPSGPGPATASPSAAVGEGGNGATSPGWARATEAVDAVRARFGHSAVAPAVTLGRESGQGQKAGGTAPGRAAIEGGND
jgi:DNA polymerase IV